MHQFHFRLYKTPFLILHFLVLVRVCVSAQVECEHPDFNALVEFYEATNGNEWTNNSGWKEGAMGENCDPCGWYGISCNEDSRIFKIELAYNNLSGKTTTNLYPLNHLKNLYLDGNQLGGPLPNIEGTLIEILSLGDNSFTGPIPPHYGEANLTDLFLQNNKLHGCFSVSLKNLCEVNVYVFGNDQLDNQDFENFCISDEGICEFEVEQNQYEYLIEFYISLNGDDWFNNEGWHDGSDSTNNDYCSWYGITCEDGNVSIIDLDGDLSSINSSVLGNNLIGSIPLAIESLYKLDKLFLANNQIEGELPISLFASSYISSINLSNNQLQGDLSLIDLNNVDSRIKIDLSKNEISGFPKNPSNLIPTGQMNLQENIISGCIPQEYKNICPYDILRLGGNTLLPWEGQFSEYCSTLGSNEVQVGAPCDDGITSNGYPDYINEDCTCGEAPVSTNEESTNVVLYPNPVNTALTIRGLRGPFSIFDFQGKMIKSNLGSETIDVSDLTNGMYILEAKYKGSIIYHKFIKEE